MQGPRGVSTPSGRASWRRPGDGQGSSFRQDLCGPLADRRNGQWDNDSLDLVVEAHITFQGGSHGDIAFGTLTGFLDVRYGSQDGSVCAEFPREGNDKNDPACGRGWVAMETAAAAE